MTDHYEAMQRAGEAGDFNAVERHAAALTDAEVDRFGSLEAVAGVPDDIALHEAENYCETCGRHMPDYGCPACGEEES